MSTNEDSDQLFDEMAEETSLTPEDIFDNVLPARFERITRSEVARDNWSALLREPLKLNIIDADAEIIPRPGAFLKSWEYPLYVVDLDIGGRNVEAYMPQSVITRMMENIDPSLDFETLDANARSALLEFALEGMLEDIERKAALEIKIKNAVAYAGKAVDPAFVFSLTHPQLGDFPFGLDCERALANRIRTVFDKNKPSAKTRRDIRVNVSFRVGYTHIDLSDLYDLGIGDGIIMDNCTYDQNSIYAVVNERLIGRCKISPKGPQSTGTILRRPKKVEENFIMAEPTTHQENDDPSEIGNLAELPITLVFEVGRIDMELGELEAMGEGYVFDLGKSQAHLVDIMTGGKVIGSGEIVRVGDSFGVRVKNFARP